LTLLCAIFVILPFDAGLTAAYDSMTVRGLQHLSFQMFRMSPLNHSASTAPNAAIIAGTIITGTMRP
jgi:hypothetical protein